MKRRRRRHFAGWIAVLLALALAGVAIADPMGGWNGSKGPFSWEAKRLSCGNVGDSASRVRAHTRWRTSPPNGYVRLTFTRELKDPKTGVWEVVHRQRRSTKNSALEGARGVLHWTQWFFPFKDEGGATTRHTVTFEWLRDRPPGAGADPRLLRRMRTFAPCVVAP
jgi:hypothetical protein